MIDRIRKLYSWSVPIVVIAGVLYLSLSFINGNGFGNPQKYRTELQSLRKKYAISLRSSLEPFFASISLFWKEIGSIEPPTETTPKTANSPKPTSTDSHIFIITPTSTSQQNTSSSKNNFSPLFSVIGNNSRKTPSFFNGSVTPPFTVVSNIPTGPLAPDLAIQIIDIGILNGDIFTHATSVQPGQHAAIIFDIKNIGRGISPQWNFSAKIPTPSRDFTSETQAALLPGEGIRFTMGFSNLEQSATNTISFVVDPNTRVQNDPDRKNNIASATLFRNF